jgi:hypothetical protein
MLPGFKQRLGWRRFWYSRKSILENTLFAQNFYSQVPYGMHIGYIMDEYRMPNGWVGKINPASV